MSNPSYSDVVNGLSRFNHTELKIINEIIEDRVKMDRLEQIIVTMKAGLSVIARTDPYSQSVAEFMQYEASATLRIVDQI